MSIFFSTPCYGNSVTKVFLESCLKLKENLIYNGVDHAFHFLGNESLITRGRDTCAAAFLKTDYERMMFIDSDIEFRVEDVIRLWNLNADIAVGAYRTKKQGSHLAVWKDGKLTDLEGFKEPMEVEFAGTGFMMIKREVFQAMIKPDIRYEDGDPREERWAFFQDPVIDGWKASEDYFFVKTAREYGFKVICDPAIKLVHWGQYGFA